jgi:hypothetical protein
MGAGLSRLAPDSLLCLRVGQLKKRVDALETRLADKERFCWSSFCGECCDRPGQSGIGYGFDSLGDRIQSLFPPALAVNILGHVDICVTQNVPHKLRPCDFAQHMAGMHGAEAPKTRFIDRIGRVRISAKAVC